MARTRRDVWTPKCIVCGRFTGYHKFQRCAPFGGYGDDEPPDDEVMCHRCVRAETERHLREQRLPIMDYAPYRWAARVAHRLGYIAVHYPYNAWSQWAPRFSIPDGMVPSGKYRTTGKHRMHT